MDMAIRRTMVRLMGTGSLRMALCKQVVVMCRQGCHQALRCRGSIQRAPCLFSTREWLRIRRRP